MDSRVSVSYQTLTTFDVKIRGANTVTDEQPNLPAQIASALVSIPKALTPGVIKALDRLLGAAVDIPVAWLAQKKAQIEAQTESYKLVEAAIANTVATNAGADPETAHRAMNVLIRKEYRKQMNREAVAAAMVEDLREHLTANEDGSAPQATGELDEDWLNVFERYAEDASSERLQGLWGRVLAGEIRGPGRFSTRTLRFLSEFSQADASTFEAFSKTAFGEFAPKQLAKPADIADITGLINMESCGLIQGASGLGLRRTMTFNNHGYVFLKEGDIYIVLKGNANTTIDHECIALTPLGQELLPLVTSRNARDTARVVARSLRTPLIHECYIGVGAGLGNGNKIQFTELLWRNDTPDPQILDGEATPTIV